jgi:CSLREA domain-containing protein
MANVLCGRLLGLASLFGVGVAAALLATGTGSAAKAAPPTTTTTTTTTCTLTPQLRGVTINQGLNSYLALARGKEALVRPYLSLPSCAWGVGAIQVTGGSVTVKNGTTALGTVGPTPAVATPYPQLPTFATAPMQDGPADLKFVVPGSLLAPGSTTARWTAAFEIAIRFAVKANSTDAAYGSEQTVSFTTFGGNAITKTVEQRTRAVGILFVPMGLPLDGATSSALLNGLSAFSSAFPYPDGTTPAGTSPGVRLGDLAGVQGGVRYAINAGVLNVGTLPFCGNAGTFEPFRASLAQYRQAWNTGNAAGISAGTVSAADKVIGVVNEANSLGGAAGCLEGYAAVTSPEAWIRGSTTRAGSLLGMEFCHTFGCVPPARSDGAYHSLQTFSDVLAGDVNRGFSVIDRTLIDRPRTMMRLVDSLADPWTHSTTLLERDDYAFMLCQMGGFAARNTPCTTSGNTGTLTGVAAGPTFVMSGSTDGTPAPTGTSITNAYFETGVAQTTPLQGSVYSLVQKNGSTVLRTDGVPVSVDHTAHHDDDNDAGTGRGVFSIAFPFNTAATTIEFRKAGVALPLYVFNKTQPPVVESFTVSTGTSDGPVVLRSAETASRALASATAVARTQALAADSNCDITQPRSIEGTTPSTILFVNESGRTVDLYWLDYEGQRVFYQTIPAGESREQPTWITHPWVTIDGEGNCIGYTVSTEIEQTYVIQAPVEPPPPAGLVVNTTDDTDDGGCTEAHCSLREAINAANANGGADTITFAIAPGGVQTITPTGSPLPVITDPVTIDGTSQTGFDGSPLIELVGTTISADGDSVQFESGLTLNTDDSTIKGLVIRNFTTEGWGTGIDLRPGADNNRIEGNYLGTNWQGAASFPNLQGIVVRGLGNRIGGTAVGARNVISGNTGSFATLGTGIVLDADGNFVEGNYVGTNATGSGPLANRFGIYVANRAGNTIGGTAAGAGNVVSGNVEHGIVIQGASATGNKVEGNIVGLDASGTSDLGNGREGVRINSASQNVVGGATAAQRNIVSGNDGHGVLVYGSTNNTVQGNYAGTDAAGNVARGNGIDGIGVDGGATNTIVDNVASGNANQGIAIFGVDFATSTGNVVQGNRVGIKAAALDPVPNGGDGVRVHNASNTTIGGTGEGVGNIIIGNQAHGVAVFADPGNTATGNRIARNEISSNVGLGIDLGRDGVTANDVGGVETTPDTDSGANNLQNYPALTEAARIANGSARIRGSLRSTPSTAFRIDFYANAACDTESALTLGGRGEGDRWIGFATASTSAAGTASIDTGTGLTAPVAVDEEITATATDPDGNTSEFSVCQTVTGTGTPPTEPGDVFLEATGTDDNPGTLSNPLVRGTLYWRCGSGGPNYPLVVDALPSAISGNQVEFDIQLDTEPLCADNDGNGTFTFRITDLWQQSAETEQSRQVAPSGEETPTVSILNPTAGEIIRENAGVTLVGSAFDYEDEALPPSAHQWTVICESGCSGFSTLSRSGPQVDVPTTIPGTYRATLIVTDSDGNSASTSVTYVVAADSDNDGMTDTAESGPCFPAGAANDPTNLDDDYDGDGIWNANDPAPCTPHTGAYQADGDFNPDPLPLQSRSADPAVTFYVTLPYRDLRQVDMSTVRITSIGGRPASIPATSWSVAATGIATAKFDRGSVINFVNANGFQNTTIVIEVEGQSISHGWSFFASDATTTRN